LPPELLLLAQIYTKSFVGWGFAHWGAYSAPPDHLAGLRGLLLRGGEGRRGEGSGRGGVGKRRGKGGEGKGTPQGKFNKSSTGYVVSLVDHCEWTVFVK